MRTFLFTASLAFLLCVLPTLPAQQPSDFRWISGKTPSSELTIATEVLKSEKITEIDRIGLIGHHALVFASLHDTELDDHKWDLKPLYDVDLETKKFRFIVGAHRIRTKGWLNFDGNTSDLGITYLDCSECEAVSIFTALYYEAPFGWKGRWLDPNDSNAPGMWFLLTDVGDPYTDEEVDQVFAVVQNERGIAEAGRWYHSRDLQTQKISDDVMKCFVTNSVERCTELSGEAAKTWKIQLCKAPNVPNDLRIGQDTKACKVLLASVKQLN